MGPVDRKEELPSGRNVFGIEKPVSQTTIVASVIVVNYNGGGHLEPCLSSLYSQSYPKDKFDIILLDNASSDHSAELAATRFPWLRLVRSETNLGYAGGANLGAKYAQGELLVFLNNDVRLSKDWLGNLIAAADLEDRAAIVGSKIFLENRPGILNHAGGLISYIGAGFDIGLGMPDTTPSDTFNVGYASGAALMIPRKLFEELRGFDESYFLYCEDVDLCWRAWMRGHRVVVQPSATLFHSFDNMRSQSHYWLRFFHWHKNSMTNILKNFEISLLFRGLVLHLVLQVARVVSSIRWSSPWRIITLIRADAWVAKNLRSIIAKRASIQASRKLRDRDLIRMGVFSSARETGIRGRRMFAFRFT